ncbi:LOW QUALITY PROTEIN: ATPase, dynein-related, AAA domain, partial [Dillenia turbinata]
MAIDGTFNLFSEFLRFLSRCPKLSHAPQFTSLSSKGQSLTEEEVVNSVAELLINPDYTIPLMGCFRPIAQKIVDKTVTLLSLVPNLKSNSDNMMVDAVEENYNYSEIIHVIEFHVNGGQGLILHELACFAFSRVLDLAPFLLGSVLNYFRFAPCPFERIARKGSTFGLSAEAGPQLLRVVRTSYRLLLVDTEGFSKCWDWSSYLDLVQQPSDFDWGDDMKIMLDVRWSAIQIISVILKMSDRAIEGLGLGAEEAFECSLRWEVFCQDVSIEKAGCYVELCESMDCFDAENPDSEVNNCMQSFGFSSVASSSKFQEIVPLIQTKRLVTRNSTSSSSPFVLTKAVKKSFQMVILAVTQKWPVLLYGPAGTGKTAIINKLAWDSGNRVLSIHMDEQIDGKTLIGSYVSSEQPGEFRWQPGSLTQAVMNGFWVVFEDIDQAPSDVQSIISPLMEGASSFATGRGESIRVAESFRLFATVSSSKLDIIRDAKGKSALGSLWRRVLIRPLDEEDFLEIVKAWYPNLGFLAKNLVETFIKVNQLMGFNLGGLASSGASSRFTLRDLLKWCKRISALNSSFAGYSLSVPESKSIYQEAIDIFASFSTSPEKRLYIMKEISKIWSVPVLHAEDLYPRDKPVIQDLGSELQVGRIFLNLHQPILRPHRVKKTFAEIRSSLHVLEKLACSVKFNEPVLLVGETGTGKTTLVQNLAMMLGQKIFVLNMSQQSDVADLLGGYRPMDARLVCIPLYNEFGKLFSETFSEKGNQEFLVYLKRLVYVKDWNMLLSGFQKAVRKLVQVGSSGGKRKRPLDEKLLKAWETFSIKVESARGQVGASAGMIFSFVEGAFVTALRHGDWILLDEVNLAPPETLQRVISVLEGENGSLCLAERGDVDYIYRHPNFRLFACMNPANDAGKRDLPYSLRSRFTEYFVDDVLDDKDLTVFVDLVMEDSNIDRDLVSKIVHFYKAAKKESEERLQDSANQKPQFSLRSLYRALEYTKKARTSFGFQRAIYDGFCMFFLTLLDEPSAKLMNQMILSSLLGGSVPPHVPFDGYLMITGNSKSNDFSDNYVLTKTVKQHLQNLARAIFIRRYPVLLQGPTSSGKTSLVRYLAAVTGHEFVRINNHEHTDIQEYIGSYITDASGKLVFHEGALVKAVRNGYWIVLDELNLAPSDVLEALNRLLDDNRELFVPELNETIRPHQDFMLFATQNPPTLYGGRKMLSRAFRNRFVEIHVDEIPDDELCTILEKRCKIPESYAKKMVEVMKDLQLHRQSSKVFAGKHGFITPRDLFRWAGRLRTFGSSYEDLAKDGYYLLAERLRDEHEKSVVQDVLERRLRVKLVRDDIYKQVYVQIPKRLDNGIIWTKSMRRLYFLVERCYRMREPVLLVGETGGGKTTVCQLLSIILGSKLHILNCHQYTETSDFLGGFYPVRERSKLASEFKYISEKLILSNAFINFPDDIVISSDIAHATSTLDQLELIINHYKQDPVSFSSVTPQDLHTFEQMKCELALVHQKWQTIFIWQDGPLVEAMKHGDLFLVDEISLADDSVLERLNSVLESERELALAEKGGSALEKITAHPEFFILATMNPGGDYGKKELSPALRNRFTEIWVPSVSDLSELRSIALERLSEPRLLQIVDPILNFWNWFNQLEVGRILTVRDLLSWVAFINATESNLSLNYAFLHGAFLVLLDGLSLGTGISKSEAAELRTRCLTYLLEQRKMEFTDPELCMLDKTGDSCVNDKTHADNLFGNEPTEVDGFEFLAPTTHKNALRILRAMQLSKPVLLEGSPGVGKTSLIVALGRFSGHRVVRINLSEQTDIMDLLGSDLPIESEEGMQFAWSDGILLQALKNGYWVLLDELNLAPQSVLEGLNAILDHRAEVFIPELGLTFKCPSSFRVFACQNPSYQGGGRKGLPKSFLNRFTKVFVDELVEDDYLFICNSLYPSIPKPILSKLISFNKRLHEETMVCQRFAQDGSPWEFNLRDVIRSCQIIQGAPDKMKAYCFLNVLYIQRMRTAADRQEMLHLFEMIFEMKPSINPYPRVQINPDSLVVGSSSIKRKHTLSLGIASSELKILPGIRQCLEAAAQCVQQQWLTILVGPESSGKISLIRLLAQLTGNELHILNLSSTTDISELLGCFEQYDFSRDFQHVITEIERYMNEYCSLQLLFRAEAFLSDKKSLVTRWHAFLANTRWDPKSVASSYAETHKKISPSTLRFLLEIIEQLRLDVEKNALPVTWSQKDLDKTLGKIIKLQKDHQGRSVSAKFEWVEGLLMKAIENGEWIVLENANLCNPTVLDRINSLVEPAGSITVNECGFVDGQPLVLQPHPNFRMFLTVDPKFGEVSRAMRNRGVEIYIMQPHWLLEGEQDYSLQGTELKDVKRFLILSGISHDRLVDLMAEAHIYVRNEALHLNLCITYLELARWVQLLQRLLSNGNKLMWSLHTSWEHTYLSSVGETGRDIIAHAKVSYLAVAEVLKIESLVGHSLCFPGGWPMPLMLRDFVYYSRETYVKQNCMYLQSLGSQCASYELAISRNWCSGGPAVAVGCRMRPYSMNMKMLHHIMIPNAQMEILIDGMKGENNAALAKKMLFVAANWTIEQATETDLQLYLLWFRWFNSQLDPFCEFFGSYLTLLEQLFSHPILDSIVFYRHELVSQKHIELELRHIPLFSVDLLNLAGLDDLPRFRQLGNAIRFLDLLRHTFQQWNDEDESNFSKETQCFMSLLESLRALEEEVLRLLLESPTFDVLVEQYSALLEDHKTFWTGLVSSQLEYSVLSWRSLMKKATKLKGLCRREVEILLMEGRNLEASSLCFLTQKSLLWAHGGHPILPSSANLYQKQQQLLTLCNSIWVDNKYPCDQEKVCLIQLAASLHPDLRFLAMQGIGMSLHVTGKSDKDDVLVVRQLEEMHQMLLGRFEFEKQKLGSNLKFDEHAMLLQSLASCCVLPYEAVCRKPFFEIWQDTVPINDNTSFLLDKMLLQDLSKIVLLHADKMKLGLSNKSNLLQSALNFSLNHLSRPPNSLLPQQKILWVLDAWTSVDAVGEKVSGFVLEMWFVWHAFLWSYQPPHVMNFIKTNNDNVLLPALLGYPMITATIHQILEKAFHIKDYFVHCLKLRVASSNLWQSFPQKDDFPSFLLATARALFQQIIYAHERSFDADRFAAIKSLFCCIENNVHTDDVQALSLLIASSSHCRLASLMDLFIEPIIKELYFPCSATDLIYKLGCAWLRIGGMRFNLLLCCDDFDPTRKYDFKASRIAEKICSLKLEIEVRRECEYLAGRLSMGETDNGRVQLLKKLEEEHRRLRRKLVFRSDPGKFKKLKYECDEFQNVITYFLGVIRDFKGLDLQQMTDQVHNWQQTATSFIERLSKEYSSYVDLIQPIQVAIYEMKLGLSLLVSSALEKDYLKPIAQESIGRTEEAIYSFMRYPRICTSKSISLKSNSRLTANCCHVLEVTPIVTEEHIHLLEKLLTNRIALNSDTQVSVWQTRTAIWQSILVRVAHSLAGSLLFDNATFMLLEKIFVEFASLWMEKKTQEKQKYEFEMQKFKFRPRAFEMERIFEMDISSLNNSLAYNSFSEWQELLTKDEPTKRRINVTSFEMKETGGKHDFLEDEWDLMEESILKNVVGTHNQLFGSSDLFLTPGLLRVSDADRLVSFKDSYTLGVAMLKGPVGLLSSNLDGKLVPENLLRVCLEHELKFDLPTDSSDVYNFYKVDPNPREMAKMVKPLITLRNQVLSLLNEWEDHPGLQKFVDVTEMLLAIPLSTPLAKAVSGLEFLLNRAEVFQETVSKFSLSYYLDPIFDLVKSWQKIEFDSWPTLLDEVQHQHEINAGKLWFPLYAALQQRDSNDIAAYTLRSLWSYQVLYRKRLQLLLAFHGQICVGSDLGYYSSPFQKENIKILYNVFGYYMQFLPRTLEHIEENRRVAEKELSEHLKLCRWERVESYLSLEKSKRIRVKLRKFIDKYNEILQQPMVRIFDQEAAQRGIGAQFPHCVEDCSDLSMVHGVMLQATSHSTELSQNERDWMKKLNFSLEYLQQWRTPGLADAEEVAAFIKTCSDSVCFSYQKDWKEVWGIIKQICNTIADCGDLWKDETRSIGKRRALSDLLKLLASCGFSRPKTLSVEEDQRTSEPIWWFLEPSYDIRHLLSIQKKSSSGDKATALSGLEYFHSEASDMEWKTVNVFYFKSLASVQLLRQICINFHKDFTVEQVNKSVNFLEHLLLVQQEQRAAAYGSAENIKRLRKWLTSVKNFCSNPAASRVGGGGGDRRCTVLKSQHALLKCMWQQKLLLDSLCTMLHEECLILKSVETTHLDGCHGIKSEAKGMSDLMKKFVPVLQESKKSLDDCLLGCIEVPTTVADTLHPCCVSKGMEELVLQNFQRFKEFEVQVCAFRGHEPERRTVKDILLGHFDCIFRKGKQIAEEFHSALNLSDPSNATEEDIPDINTSELEAVFLESFRTTVKHIAVAFEKLRPSHAPPEELLGKLTYWKAMLTSYTEQLGIIYNELINTLCAAVSFDHCNAICGDFGFHVMESNLISSCISQGNVAAHGRSGMDNSSSQLGACIEHLSLLLELVLNFGDNLLHDFVSVHKMVSKMTHVLANVLASLFSKGFGRSKEDEDDDRTHDKPQDAKGTGMGEGVGVTDVSEQINDEDQILGTSDMANEEQDAANEVPSKTDKGIEMDNDFAADTFSVSEESEDEGDNDDDDEDGQLESLLAETGADSEVVDEKLWDKEEDTDCSEKNDKYESGPSVKDKDSTCRELRAKEDSASALDEPSDLNADESGEQNDKDVDQDGVDDSEDIEDMKLDKKDAFADPTGLELEEPNKGCEEEMEMDQGEDADATEDVKQEEHVEADNEEMSADEKNDGVDEKTDGIDENMAGAESELAEENHERDNSEKDHDSHTNVDLAAPKKNALEVGSSNFTRDNISNLESATESRDQFQAEEARHVPPQGDWSNGIDAQNDLAPVGPPPSSSTMEMELMAADSSRGAYTNDVSKSQLPQPDPLCTRMQTNPYRNVGDALEEWKERVRVSTDLQENQPEPADDMVDKQGDEQAEHGFVSEFEKGTSQALGPATPDQIDKNINAKKSEGDGPTTSKEDFAEMEIEKQDLEEHPIMSSSTSLRSKIEEPKEISNMEKTPEEENPEVYGYIDEDRGTTSESVVSFKSNMKEEIHQLSKLSMNDDELGTAKHLEMPGDMKDNATRLWRRFELQTTRLSQELAEQLRLVMEPTLASRLQGDYKSGKRINMKKVIPYIASHYRKDKIWLRRTRPNKRDYQVIIAVDDSRSMSESCCGDVAIEALVTVCRAMSQLEVGNLAVASFGKKGNVQLLHDFNQPFTGEAGIKMISNLTFKQENTIADEPMVDLLKYLNNILDVAVANARLPSGQNPLQQLVLIIADGRFHEKEHLKRCVRDVLSRKRMVAFILLDSPQESIMDLMEASFQGDNIKFTKYLDSFPFPYYIVLKNINALPRTLADLLRQMLIRMNELDLLGFPSSILHQMLLPSNLKNILNKDITMKLIATTLAISKIQNDIGKIELWDVVSRNPDISKIQNDIGEQIGYSDAGKEKGRMHGACFSKRVEQTPLMHIHIYMTWRKLSLRSVEVCHLLITIGRVMARKKTLQEWRYAVAVLQKSATEFHSMGDE